MSEESVTQYLTQTFEDVHIVESNGNKFFTFGPMADNNKFPFVTLVVSDEYDDASDLNRPDVYRLNIGVSKQTFKDLFPEEKEHDFTALDTILPHPVYGKMYWVCVLSPSEETFEKVKPLLAEAYQKAAKS